MKDQICRRCRGTYTTRKPHRHVRGCDLQPGDDILLDGATRRIADVDSRRVDFPYFGTNHLYTSLYLNSLEEGQDAERLLVGRGEEVLFCLLSTADERSALELSADQRGA